MKTIGVCGDSWMSPSALSEKTSFKIKGNVNC